VWWFVRRPYTRGVKCIVRDGSGQALFVRHTYGRRSEWELPGGTHGRREAPEAAVRREMHEELGVELRDLREVVRVEVTSQFKRTVLHCFEGSIAGDAPVRLAEAEIAEARWAPLDAPPEPLGQHAKKLLALRRRGDPPD
jgi:8-oxo-dGTP pyrophosphatase MutT (NUDIX family)